MAKPLVTILSPVYNGESYLGYFLDSLLEIDYPNLEFILINDGSSDKTNEVVKSYQKKLDEKFKRFVYKTTENKGQAGAVNDGLKLVKGKYLTWPDSDDRLPKDGVAKMVNYFEKHPDVKLIVGKALTFPEEKMDKAVGILKRKNHDKQSFFEDLVIENDVYFCPGSYMIDVDAFKKITNMEIYTSRAGQNWQMILPMLYNYEHHYLDKVVFYYTLRNMSHSREGLKDYEKLSKRYDAHEDIIRTTIKNIANITKTDIKYYNNLLDIKYARKRLGIAVLSQNEDLFNENYNILKKLNQTTKLEDKLDQVVTEKRTRIYKKHLLIEKFKRAPKIILNKIIIK